MYDNKKWPDNYKVFPSKLLTTERDKETIFSYKGFKDCALMMIEFMNGMLGG